METSFNRRNAYLEVRRKFNSAWPNLRIEIHSADVFYHKEGANELAGDRTFMQEGRPDISFAVNSSMTIAEAETLFAQNLGAHAHDLAVHVIDNSAGRWIEPQPE